MRQRRLFIDLDGPTVDFDRYMRETGLTAEQVKQAPGSYLNMKPTQGAIEAIRLLIQWGYEVWIATKPPTGNAQAYADKAQWVMNYLPELTRRIILTHDKGLLGDQDDYLIDDRPHKANCLAFKGVLLHYSVDQGWPHMLSILTPPALELVTFDTGAGDDRTAKCEPYWYIPEDKND